MVWYLLWRHGGAASAHAMVSIFWQIAFVTNMIKSLTLFRSIIESFEMLSQICSDSQTHALI